MSELWYGKSAEIWEEALPLGNGRLGAMVFGNVDAECIQVNEESMWFGAPRDRHNPDALEALPKVRELIKAGLPQEAEKIMGEAMTACPAGAHPYQVLGNIRIWFSHSGQASSYRRSLQLDRAVSTVEYLVKDTKYVREIFVSKPDHCMVMKMTAKGTECLNFTLKMDRGMYFDGVKKTEQKDGLFLYGNLGQGGYRFGMMIRALVLDGDSRCVGESLVVENAKQVLLFFGAETSYHEQNATVEDLEQCLLNRLTAGMEQPYEVLLHRHEEDYRALYDRVNLQFGKDEHHSVEEAKIPTDERLKRVAEGATDNGLMKLLFDYGRYLLISSSRPGDLPATLQGIWNKDFEPAWDSKYTININAQMNYWPAEVCNLSECHTPLFDLLKKVRENGRKTADIMYGCRGFLAHHNTDIHGDSAPQDLWFPATFWTQGAAWLCTHLWTHYEYTKDVAFLEEVYPTLAEAALFYVDFLTPYGEYLVTNPSVSPENTYILPNGQHSCCCLGPTMDSQILRDLFDSVIDGAAVLGEKVACIAVPGVENVEEFISTLKEMREKLPPTRIGSDGRIMEWTEEYQEEEPGHRHISHLYGLFPSDQISVDETPELAEAARKTLAYRLSHGGGHTGWSRAWITNHYAKLWDGDSAYDSIEKMLIHSTYPNMFDKHPPFQIDGNFGVCAAMANMLVQSNEKRVILLPALPEQWSDGEFQGLCIVGNATVSAKWSNSNLTFFEINAKAKIDTVVKYKDKEWTVKLDKGDNFHISL